MTRITTLKPTNPLIWAVALFVAGGFFYANHSTIAARFGAKPVVETTSALGHVPAATGYDYLAELQW
jgi:hypothetical protein